MSKINNMSKMSKINKQNISKTIINIDTDSSIEEIKNTKDTKDKKENKEVKEVKKVNREPKKLKDSDYERPLLTYTDKLSKKEIESLLLDYEKVDNLKDVPIGTHIRYFENKDDELKFRTGGILTIKSGLPKYCILKNGKLSWSVQIANTIFFRRITIKEVKEEYEKILVQKDNELNELRFLIRDLKKKIKSYEQ